MLEAGFPGLVGWESELVLHEIISLFKALQRTEPCVLEESGKLLSVACLSSIILHPSPLYFGLEKQFFR